MLPEDWTVLDLDPRTRDRSIERLVRSAVGPADHLARLRRELVVLYRRAIHDAADHAAFFAATMGHTIEGASFGASVLGFLAPLPVGADGALLTDVGQLAAALAEPADGEVARERSMVDLGLGPAVRTRSRVGSGLAGSDGREPAVDVVQFFAPIPQWTTLLVLAFSTPTLVAADAFAELFDALARSARWRR